MICYYTIRYTNGDSDVILTDARAMTVNKQFNLAKEKRNRQDQDDTGDSLTDILVAQLIALGYSADYEPIQKEYEVN